MPQFFVDKTLLEEEQAIFSGNFDSICHVIDSEIVWICETNFVLKSLERNFKNIKHSLFPRWNWWTFGEKLHIWRNLLRKWRSANKTLKCFLPAKMTSRWNFSRSLEREREKHFPWKLYDYRSSSRSLQNSKIQESE